MRLASMMSIQVTGDGYLVEACGLGPAQRFVPAGEPDVFRPAGGPAVFAALGILLAAWGALVPWTS